MNWIKLVLKLINFTKNRGGYFTQNKIVHVSNINEITRNFKNLSM